MVDLASLRISVDSRDVKKAEADLSSMSNTAGNTSAAVDRLSASNNRLAQAVASSHKPTIDAVKYINQLQYEVESVGKSALQLKALEIRMAAARAPTAELAKEIRSLGAELIKTERAAGRAGNGAAGIPAIGKSSALAGHHVQNLTFQLQDIFVGLASGQKPMTVFMQQGTQVAGIMQQAGLGVGGFAKEIAKMTAAAAGALLVNPIFLAIAAAAGVAYVAFQDFNSEVKKSGELDRYAAGLGLTAEEMKKLGPIGITVMDVVKGVWQTISEGLGLESIFSSIGGFFTDLFRGVAATAVDLTAGLYGVFVGTYKGIVKVWDMLPAAFADLTISAVNFSIRALEGLVNKSIDLINAMITQANKVAGALNLPTIGLLSQINIPELQNNYAGAGKKAGAAFVGEIAQATKDARGAMAGFGATIGDNIVGQAKKRLSGQAKELIDERTARKAGEKAGKAAGDDFAKSLQKTVTATLGDLMGNMQGFSADFLKNYGKGSLEEMQKIVAEIDRARAAADEKTARELAENIKTATDGAQMIADIIGGSIGDGIKQLSDVLSKNFPDFMAKAGRSFKGIKDSLDGLLGSVGTSLGELGAGAQVGTAVNSIVGGSKTGAQVGGALGSAIGGPVGAIAGSILGSVVGGLFKKTKSASATIAAEAGKLDVAGLVGNNAQFKQTANTLAGAVISGLNNAANALGAEITNAINLSIGQRKGKFVVDTLGQGRTKGGGTMSFATEAEAISFAIDKALRDGVFSGIEAGTERLLKGFGDVEGRLAKAVDFENVFTSLRKELDPLGFAIENLDKRFADLRKTFAEAGATSEEYAKLEQLYQIERGKAVEANTKAAKDETAAMELARQAKELEITLVELEGNAVGALAMRREQELSAMDASLQSMQRLIYAQEDINSAQEALTAARQAEQSAIGDLRSAIEQLDAGVAAAEAKLQEAIRGQRQREIEALRSQITQLDAIIARRDVAQQALRRAYDAEISRIDAEIGKRNDNIKSLEAAYSSQANVIQGTIEQFRDFASSLRDFASTIIPMNGSGPQSLEALRRRFADVTQAALGGDRAAMGQVTGVGGQLRESIIANATDRTSMLRQLYALQSQTLQFANQADQQGTIAEQQLAALRAQYDAMIAAEQNAIANYEAQKVALTAQVEQLIQLNEQTLSVNEGIRQLETAEAAAAAAEIQQAQLEQQVNSLIALDANIISVEEAQRELAEAQAARDSVLAEINKNGFTQLIAVTAQTGAQMASAAMTAISTAQSAIAQAQTALTAANEAKVGAAAAAAAAQAAANAAAATTAAAANVAAANAAAAQTAVNDNTSMTQIQTAIDTYTGGGAGSNFFGMDRKILPYANGGFHSGGLRIVGENGPELEATGPSRIYNSNQLSNAFGGNATAAEVKAMRDELRLAMYQIAKNTGKSYDLLDRWNGDGLPPERNVA